MTVGVIDRVAGTTGVLGSSGDGGPATDATLEGVIGLAATPDGGFLIADYAAQVVRAVSPTGVITRVAGTTGVAGSGGDGGPAVDATLNGPYAVAATADGGFLVADGENHTVRRVRPDGVITRVAGMIGTLGNGGDDGRATDATLSYPVGLAVTPEGGFLVGSGSVVRRVSPTGVIRRVAGTGVFGSSGDDGLATAATLGSTTGLAALPGGGFLVADFSGHLVRRISAAGVITRVAGTGTSGRGGDDGPAVNASLSYPRAVALTTDGGFLIADSGNLVVRRVSATGVITRVAGTGVGAGGDGGPATSAGLGNPLGVAVRDAGRFLIADLGNAVVREVTST